MQSINYLRIVALAVIVTFVSCKNEKYHVIIKNAMIIDGSGTHGRIGDVGINADTIAMIGDLSKANADTIIDAGKLVLSPGFIDSHSHHDRGMFENRELAALTSQGVTTMIIGQDGGSRYPVKELFEQVKVTPLSINVGSYTGHNTLRRNVLGEKYQRISTQEEIDRMAEMLREDLAAGSLGLSTGLEYDPGIYSTEDEVLQLTRVLAPDGARYISHIRSEDRSFWKAIDEIINLGKSTGVPVQISHAKLAMKSLWGQSEKLITKLDSARATGIDITADVYPYTYWQSTMKVLFPERNFKDRKAAEFALSELTTPEGVIIGNYSPIPEYIGKTLAEVAVIRKKDAAQTLMDLIDIVDENDGDESIIATSMAEDDITKIIKWPYSSICSDGTSDGLHPRGHGSFPKIIRYYVREQKALTLEDAIQKMTHQAAKNLNLQGIGLVKVGYAADLVLFDPQAIADHATYQEPHAASTGIQWVMVNGKIVMKDGISTHQFPGKIILRSK